MAARTDIPLSTLSGYLSGRELKLSVARKITEACGVSLDWLAAGEDGPAAREFGNARQAGPESVEFLNYDVILSAHQGVDGDSSYIETRISIPRDFLPLSIQSNTDNISAVTAKCDSMNPIIDDGDILLIRTDVHTLTSGSIYALRVENTLLVRRLILKTNGNVQVISENPRYPTEELNAEDVRRMVQDDGFPARIIGRVIWRAGSLIP